jgi:hypothetical protein
MESDWNLCINKTESNIIKDIKERIKITIQYLSVKFLVNKHICAIKYCAQFKTKHRLWTHIWSIPLLMDQSSSNAIIRFETDIIPIIYDVIVQISTNFMDVIEQKTGHYVHSFVLKLFDLQILRTSLISSNFYWALR